MIWLEVSGVHTELDEKVRDYANNKIGNLYRYLPKHAKFSVRAELHLKKHKNGGNKYVASAAVHLPHQMLVAHEQGNSFEAVIDLTEANLKSQIRKYKELHSSSKLRRHLFRRIIRTT